MSCTPRPCRAAPAAPVARRPRSVALVAVALVLAGLATGCAGPSDDPREVGEGFAAAVADGRLEDACALLTPAARDDLGDDCAASLGGLDVAPPGPVTGVETYGRAALVRYDDTVAFLARTGSTWQVRAADCSPPAEAAPADCTVAGD